MDGINLLISAVVGIVVVGVIATFGLDLLSDQKAEFTANSMEANATQDAADGVAKIPQKLPLIAGAVVAAVVIFLLIRYFRV